VTTALDADPPLPGESVHDWPGLEPGRRADASVGHEHHHHGGAMPAASPSARPAPDNAHRLDHAEHGATPSDHAGHGHDVTEAPKRHVTPEAGTRSDGAREWRFGGGVNVTLPVFDRNQGSTAALEAAFDAALERHLGLATDLRSAARQARARVVSTHARARKYQDVIVPAQRRVSEQTLLQYNAMQLGIFQVLAARRDALQVELAELETLRSYWTAVAALDALLAGVHVDGATSEGARSTVAASSDEGGH